MSFVVCRLLFDACGSLIVALCVLLVACSLLFVDWCVLLFAVRRVLLDVSCSSFIVPCLLCIVSCFMFVVCRSLSLSVGGCCLLCLDCSLWFAFYSFFLFVCLLVCVVYHLLCLAYCFCFVALLL